MPFSAVLLSFSAPWNLVHFALFALDALVVLHRLGVLYVRVRWLCNEGGGTNTTQSAAGLSRRNRWAQQAHLSAVRKWLDATGKTVSSADHEASSPAAAAAAAAFSNRAKLEDVSSASNFTGSNNSFRPIVCPFRTCTCYPLTFDRALPQSSTTLLPKIPSLPVGEYCWERIYTTEVIPKLVFGAVSVLLAYSILKSTEYLLRDDAVFSATGNRWLFDLVRVGVFGRETSVEKSPERVRVELADSLHRQSAFALSSVEALVRFYEAGGYHFCW